MENLVGLKHLKLAHKYFNCEIVRQLSFGSCLLSSTDFTVQDHFPDIHKLRMRYFIVKRSEESYKDFICNELIEECNIKKSSFQLQGYEKKFIISMDIEKLKKHGLLSPDSSKMNLANRLLTHLEPFPFDSKHISSLNSNTSHSVTIKAIRDSIEKQYLAWKFKVDLQQITDIFFRLQPCLYTCRSLRNLRRNSSILNMIPFLEKKSLSKKIYLINQQPFSVPLVLNFYRAFPNFNWDFFLSSGHKTLQCSLYHIYFFIKILLSKGFTQRQIQESIPFLHLGLDKFINKMNIILSHPALSHHQRHDGFLQLLQYPTASFINLESSDFQSFDEVIMAINVIHARVKLKIRGRLITINAIKFHTSNYFPIGSHHLNIIKRHPKYSVISEEQLSSTLKFLKKKGFSTTELLESIIIILYPRRVIDKALKKIVEEAKTLERVGFVNGRVSQETNFFKPGTKLKQKTLQLCLYHIEKQYNFSWDGVLNLLNSEEEKL